MIAFDTTPFVRASIKGVVETLIEAVVLVFFVMLLFLQTFRATLIPTIAVPVVLLGTFGVLAATGFSINMLTMFAMVLAIGLLVDDAIVVVENVERIMREEGLTPLEATRKSMRQIASALVGIGLVLSAVFVPMAFLSGSTGVIYRQFSITIVSAMTLSVLVALILTPALCATLLKPASKDHGVSDKGFFARFNRFFDVSSRNYRKGVRAVLARSGRFMAIFAVLCVGAVVLFFRLPGAFVPEEDMGSFLIQIQAPVGATQDRTLKSIEKVEQYIQQKEKDVVASTMAIQGFSFAGAAQNTGIAFVRLKDWSDRNLSVNAVVGRTARALSGIKDALIYPFNLPAIPELGTASGISFLSHG